MFGFGNGGESIERGPDDVGNILKFLNTPPPHPQQKKVERIILAWRYHDFISEKRAQKLLEIIYNGTYEDVEAVKKELFESVEREGIDSFDGDAHRPVSAQND